VLTFDRWLTLYGIAPFRRLFIRREGRVLPILMYHSISDDPETGVSSYYRTCTSPGRFAEQMNWLAANGWKGVSLRDGLAWLAEGKGGSDKPVALTFDDGFRDFYTAAVPAMRKVDFRATMYLVTDFVGLRGAPGEFKGRPCLTWDDVRDLHADGFEFGSHTASHPELIRVDRGELLRQLTASRDAIVHHLNEPVTSFAYPYAFPTAYPEFMAHLMDTLRSTGYKNCVTTCIGRARNGSDRFLLPRLPVNQDDDTDLFATKTNGYYDWTGEMQAHFKRIRKLLRAVRGRA